MVSFDWSNNTGAIYVKMDKSLLVKKIIFHDSGADFLF